MMKGVAASLLIIVGLSVAVWLFFDSYSMRLDSEGTLVVVLICTLLVLAGRWLWGHVPKLWR
jgi:hypothetical protein